MGRVEGHADADTINAQCKDLIARLGAIEAEIYQTKNRSRQDPLNFPIRLNNKIAGLTGAVASADAKPTDQSYAVFEELSALLQAQLDRLTDIVESEIPAFNAFMAERAVPAVILREGSAPASGSGRP
jgi:kynureninase